MYYPLSRLLSEVSAVSSAKPMPMLLLVWRLRKSCVNLSSMYRGIRVAVPISWRIMLVLFCIWAAAYKVSYNDVCLMT
jgi:hypothetical protein